MLRLTDQADQFERDAQKVDQLESSSDYASPIREHMLQAARTIRESIRVSTQITGQDTNKSIVTSLEGDVQGRFHRNDKRIEIDEDLLKQSALDGDSNTIAGVLTHEGFHKKIDLEGDELIADSDTEEAAVQQLTEIELQKRGMNAGQVEGAYKQHFSKIDRAAESSNMRDLPEVLHDETDKNGVPFLVMKTTRAKLLDSIANGEIAAFNRRLAA